MLSRKAVRYIECVITDKMSIEKTGTVLFDTDIYTEIATIDYDAIMYKDTFDELLDAIKNNDNDRAKHLCVSHKIIEAKDSHGWSALTVAVYNN